MIWGSAHLKETYKHEWDIANFICQGKRLDKPDDMRNDMYQLITKCWKQDPHEKLSIVSIVEKLTELK